MFGTGAVVDDGDEESLEIDFDAGEQLRERCLVEVPSKNDSPRRS